MRTIHICRRVACWIIAVVLMLTAGVGRGADEPAENRGDAAPAGGGAGAPAEPPVRVFKTEKKKAAIIVIDREMDNVMLGSIKRRVAQARQEHCDVIVFEINAGGGYMGSALEATRFIREIDLPTVAYVHDTAMNTAAMLALACQHIVVSSDASLGNIPPGGGTGSAEDRKQLAAPILADLEASCRRSGLSLTLASAMVDPAIVLHEVRKDNETRFVETKEKDRLLNDEVVNPEGKRIRPWQYVGQIDGPNDYLSVHPGKQAVDMGLARTVIIDDADLLSALRTTQPPVRMELSFLEKAVLWLTTWPVRGVLFILMLVLAWIEFSHPGIGVAGIGALICLGLLVGAPFLTGLAQVWEILVILVGVAIIVVDLVLYGGVGLLAIPGFVLLAIGLVASFVPSEPGSGWMPTGPQVVGLQKGLGVVVFGSMISLGLFVFMAKYLYMAPGFRRLQLAPTGTNLPDATVRDATERPADEAVFVGALGKVASDLRPAGKARFGEHLIDVLTQGQFVVAGTVVEVLEIRGARILVRAPKPHEPAAEKDIPEGHV